MAEIHVQEKRRGLPFWMWIVIAILIIAAVAAVIVYQDNKKPATEQTKPVSFIQPVKSVPYYIM